MLWSPEIENVAGILPRLRVPLSSYNSKLQLSLDTYLSEICDPPVQLTLRVS